MENPQSQETSGDFKREAGKFENANIKKLQRIFQLAVLIAAAFLLCGNKDANAKEAKGKPLDRFLAENMQKLDITEEVEAVEEIAPEPFRIFLRNLINGQEKPLDPESTEKIFDIENWALIAECDESVSRENCFGRTSDDQVQAYEEIAITNKDGTMSQHRLIIFPLKYAAGKTVTFGTGENAVSIDVPQYMAQPPLTFITPQPELEKKGPLPPETPPEDEVPSEDLEPGIIEEIIENANVAYKDRVFRISAGPTAMLFTNDPAKKQGGLGSCLDLSMLWRVSPSMRVGIAGNFGYSGTEQEIPENTEGVQVVNGGVLQGHNIDIGTGPVFEGNLPIGNRWRAGISLSPQFNVSLRSFEGKNNVGVSEDNPRQMMDIKGAKTLVSAMRAKIGLLFQHAKGFFAGIGIGTNVNLTPVQEKPGFPDEKNFAASMDVGMEAGYQF